MPYLTPLIEHYIVTFYQALASNLGSSNVGVRKQTEGIL